MNCFLRTANRMYHSTLYSNLPSFATHLPVIYGKQAPFEPLFKHPIFIFAPAYDLIGPLHLLLAEG